MSRTPRDRDAEQTAIRAAADRLLTGIPLHSTTGTLTSTELITESGLRRDVVYEHRGLVDDHTTTKKELASVKEALTKERTTNSVLRRAIAELSLELEQAREELAQDHKVTRLPTRSQS
jgi:hypothetical protein